MSAIKLNRPIFIIGNPRSGTTLLRLLLTSHSDILIPPECGFLIWLLTKYSDWQQIYNNTALLNEFLDALFASRKFDTWRLERDFIKAQILRNQPESYPELCAVIYAAFGLKAGRSFHIWGDKNNFHLEHLAALYSLYPDARFLHIVRDGRDVACSYRELAYIKSCSPYKPKLPTEINAIAREWTKNVLKADVFLSTLRTNAAITIKYEELVETPQKVLTEICDWLNVPFESNMLSFHENNRINKLEPDLTMDWKKNTLLPINSSALGRFKKILSEKDKIAFHDIAGSVLHKFKYI